MSLEERVKELRDIRDIREFSKSVDFIIENYIKQGDVGLNWIELTGYIDDLYKSMNECNKNKEKLGITFINNNNALVFMLREKIREILREANAIVGYDEVEAFNIRLVNSISVDYFKDSIMNVFKEVDIYK